MLSSITFLLQLKPSHLSGKRKSRETGESGLANHSRLQLALVRIYSRSSDANSLLIRIGDMDYLKIVIVGDDKVGKTCLFARFSAGQYFGDAEVPDYGVQQVNEVVDRVAVNIALWDSTSGEEYKKLRPLEYPSTDVFFLCFSVARPDSLDQIRTKWAPEVRYHIPNAPYILVATQKDLRREKDCDQSDTVTSDQGRAVAREIGAIAYFETSSLRGEGIREPFEAAVRAKRGVALPDTLGNQRRPSNTNSSCTLL